MATLRDYGSLVRFSHSIFALPFALCGAWLAAGGVPHVQSLLLVVVCAVCARTAAMAFNRLVDARIDAQNPRTAQREIPSGKISPAAAIGLIVVSSLGFIAAAFGLNALSGWLSLPVLGVLFLYSYMKRLHWSAHLVLGLSLAIAPLGAYLAVRGEVRADVEPVLYLALAVLTWVAGFDLIYACQDAQFDREQGLASIPARFGIARALQVSALLHGITVVALLLCGFSAHLGWCWWVALALASALLWYEHHIVRPHDLSRVNMAFFTLNGWVGAGLFVGLALDRALAGASP